jgi:hypothetical protein
MCQVHTRDVARHVWLREYNKSGPLTKWFDWSKISTSLSGQHICARLLRAHNKSGHLTTWFRLGESWSSTAQGIQGSYQPGFVRCPGVSGACLHTHTYMWRGPGHAKYSGKPNDQGVCQVPQVWPSMSAHTGVCVCEKTTTSHKPQKTTRGIYRSKINHCQTGLPILHAAMRENALV